MRAALFGPTLVLVAVQLAAAAPSSPDERARREGDGVAVIVNESNACADPTFQELRELLRLERQFWRDGKRVVLLLPPSGSMEKQVLLETVYHSTDAGLRKEWAGRLFAGEIAAVPASLRSADALVAAVRRSSGAIAVVSMDAGPPPGVRILTVGGKRPGEPGYPLLREGP